MSNRRVKVIYTKESGRPPFYTTEDAIHLQERHFREIIKEVVLVEDENKKLPLKPVEASDVKPTMSTLTLPKQEIDYDKLVSKIIENFDYQALAKAIKETTKKVVTK